MISIKLIKEYLEIINLLKNPKEDYPKLYNQLRKNEPIKVLDLGSNVPLSLFLLYHSFESDTLRGVDCYDQLNCIDYFLNQKKRIDPEHLHKYRDAKCFFDIYTEIITVSDDEVPKLKDRDEFDNIFCKPFVQSEIENYLIDEAEKYDLVIVSDVLHIFTTKKVQTVLPKIKCLIKEDGLIFIRFHNEGKPEYINYDSFKKMLFKEFNLGDLFEYSNDGKWNHSVFCNIPNLIDPN